MVGRDVEHLEVRDVVLDLGDSKTTNPNRPKISAISAIASMLGWRLPRATGRPAVVTSSPSAPRRVSRAAELHGGPTPAPRKPPRSQPGWGWPPPDLRSVLGRQRADAARDEGQPTLLAQDVHLEGGQGLRIRGGGDPRERLVPGAPRGRGSAGRGPRRRRIRRRARPRRSSRRSRHRGRRGRRGSSGRSRCRPASGRR